MLNQYCFRKMSKANWSNKIEKNLLILTVKSVNLGKFAKQNKDQDIWVWIMWGAFYVRTSYIREDSGIVTINEKLVIDLDNDINQEIKIFVYSIPKNNADQTKKDKFVSNTLGNIDLEKPFWPKRSKNIKLYMLEDSKETDLMINIEAFATFETPTNGKNFISNYITDTLPWLMEGNVILWGRNVLFWDTDPFEYPPNQFIFNSWEWIGDFNNQYVQSSILPLWVPNREEFERKFNVDYSYDQFLQRYKFIEPERITANPYVPHAFILPNSEDEFIEKQYSGDYSQLLKEYKIGDLVAFLTSGPIFRPAKLRRLGIDWQADIEFNEINQDQIFLENITVSLNDIVANEYAGPNVFIDSQTQIPKSISDWEYDIDMKFSISLEDIELLREAIGVKSNAQYFRKLANFRRNPWRPAPKVDHGNADYVTGDLIITIVSVDNLKYNPNEDNEIYVKINTVELEFNEEDFGNFALDDSFQKSRESQQNMSKSIIKTNPRTASLSIDFNEEK